MEFEHISIGSHQPNFPTFSSRSRDQPAWGLDANGILVFRSAIQHANFVDNGTLHKGIEPSAAAEMNSCRKSPAALLNSAWNPSANLRSKFENTSSKKNAYPPLSVKKAFSNLLGESLEYINYLWDSIWVLNTWRSFFHLLSILVRHFFSLKNMRSHCVILSFSPVGQGTPWSWLWRPGDVLMSHSHQGPVFFVSWYNYSRCSVQREVKTNPNDITNRIDNILLSLYVWLWFWTL